jgi:polyisoprenoid-binding protein YceI
MTCVRIVSAVLLAGRVFLRTSLAANAEDVKIDPAHSRASFSVSHVMVARVTGTVPIVAGTITLAPDGVTPVAVNAVLDPRRLSTGDPDRDGDLQGDGWFDSKKFSTWNFKSDAVTLGPNATLSIAGTITIHGVTRPVTLAVTVAPAMGYHATAHLDRHQFGMKAGRMDSLIGSDVTIDLDISTVK